MSPASLHRRRGMTLVELLVVISILGLLAVTVIPNISNTGERRKVREGARAVSSFIAAGQSRALGSRNGGGVWIDEPLANAISSDTLSMTAAIDLAEAEVGQSYAGDSTQATATFAAGSAAASTATVTFAGGCTPPSNANNLIRFGNSSSLFSLSAVSGSTATVVMRSNANQTVSNTSWPRPGMAVPYEIIGPPTRSTGATLTLGDGVAIDVTHSWFQGTSLQSTVGSAAFQILFDTTGKPQSLVLSNGTRLPITHTLYLLVASIEAMQTTGTSATRAPQGSYWIAIDPMGGIPKVAEVNASGTTIVEQQSFIRSGAVQYGR